MRTRLEKWGNGLALRISQPQAKAAGLEEHSPVEITLRDGTLIVRAPGEREFTLDELVSQITEKNLHPEFWPLAPDE